MRPESSSNGKFSLSKKIKVGVLAGGRSSERKISIRSGRAVYQALHKIGFQTSWIDPRRRERLFRGLKDIDMAFIALHGQGGEDGTIQAFLEKKGIPYVGSAAHACSCSFDKQKAKRIFDAGRIPTPEWTVVNRKNFEKRLASFPEPFFVKPLRDGSSIGIIYVEEFEKSVEKINKILRKYRTLLIERKIEGREFTVGILGDRALPVIELRPKRTFYDFRAKYTKGMTTYIVPARIPKKQSRRLQAMALRVHHRLGLQDLSRVDFMVDQRGKPFVLEANAIPGFTELSLLPKAAKADGVSFRDLCYELIHRAFQRSHPKAKSHGKKTKKKTRT